MSVDGGGQARRRPSARRRHRSVSRPLAAALVLAASASCIPVDAAAAAPPSDGRDSAAPADDATVHLSSTGAWGDSVDWPTVAIHAALMPDGTVMTYGSETGRGITGLFSYDVWDPSVGGLTDGHELLPNTTATDLFCNIQLLVPGTGQLLSLGGDVWDGLEVLNQPNSDVVTYDPQTRTVADAGEMLRSRWYATAITLPNGDTYIQGGLGGEDRAEVRRRADGRSTLLPFSTEGINHNYPDVFVTPSGRLFGIGAGGSMYWISRDLTTLTVVGNLPEQPRWYGNAVMYRPGKVLVFGGPSRRAFTIDVTGNRPIVEETGSMSAIRIWSTGTILPDGRVLATGGSGVENELVDVSTTAEIWDPDSGVWTVGAAGARPRLYHSTAMLLPSGSVLVAGGNARNVPLEQTAEEYLPPYLLDELDQPLDRPVIDGLTSATMPIGATVGIATQDAASVSRVTLVKSGSVTHSINVEQRFVELPFTAADGVVTATLPASAAVTTPGYYLLTVFDADGVPSESKIVELTVPVAPVSVTASQASTGYGGVASRAVDGNTSGVFSGGSVTYVPSQPRAWWQVDRGTTGPIGSVTIHNRTDAVRPRLADFTLYVSDSPIGSSPDTQPGVTAFPFPGVVGRSATIATAVMGRFVRVQLNGTGALSLAEVVIDDSFPATTCPTGRWRTTYWNNASMAHHPRVVRCEGTLNHDWGTASPAPSVNRNDFSVQWVTDATVDAGTTTFVLTAKGGVRLLVDDQVVFDAWVDRATTTDTVPVRLTAGRHRIAVEHYSRRGTALASASWSTFADTCPIGRWKAHYFANPTMTGTPVVSRCERTIDADWGDGAPVPGLPADGFSVRWSTGAVFAAGDLVLTSRADDGMRVSLDGRRVLDGWGTQQGAEISTTQPVSAGVHGLVVTYSDVAGPASARLTAVLQPSG